MKPGWPGTPVAFTLHNKVMCHDWPCQVPVENARVISWRSGRGRARVGSEVPWRDRSRRPRNSASGGDRWRASGGCDLPVPARRLQSSARTVASPFAESRRPRMTAWEPDAASGDVPLPATSSRETRTAATRRWDTCHRRTTLRSRGTGGQRAAAWLIRRAHRALICLSARSRTAIRHGNCHRATKLASTAATIVAIAPNNWRR